MIIEKFKNDNEYLNWMTDNPAALVVNTGRTNKSNLFILHRSKCPHIATTASMQSGAYTERGNLKIASEEFNELINYFTQHYTKFKGEFRECKTCKPFTKK